MFHRLSLVTATILIGLTACCPSRTPADIALTRLFSDHMVLQRNSSVRVWGTANPEEKLTVKLGDLSATATADTKGRWSTMIKTGPAGGPFDLEVSVDDTETKVVVSNILIGDVWICAGQSNMQWPVSESSEADADIEQAKNHPNLRLFTVEHQAITSLQSDFARVKPWSCCTPESVKEFSAVAYFFGRELSTKLKIPIGLINASWGGTPCEAWISRDALDADGSFESLLRYWNEQDDPTNPNRVGNIYNGMIAPLVGYPFKGVIWYQGEANVGRGSQYRRLLPLLIKDWRKSLNQGQFPFYLVQLAPYRYEGHSPEDLPEVWDAQLATLRSVANTGLVVTTDLGDVNDIHPRNKKEVGRRLSLWAFASDYASELDDVQAEQKPESDTGTSGSQIGVPPESVQNPPATKTDSLVVGDPAAVADHSAATQTVTVARQETASSKPSTICSGPIYESYAIEKGNVRLAFRYAKGLQTRNREAPSYFLICGNDRQFVPAVATIDGETIIVSSPDVSQPVAVRFAWVDSAEPNLFNSEGLPASPFRTDNFDLSSKGIEY